MSFRNSNQETLSELLRPAGITVNGENPWDPQIQDNRAYQRIFGGGTLGIGEAYVDRDWDCEQPDELISRVLRHDAQKEIQRSPALMANIAMAGLFNMQSRNRSRVVAEEHYDLPIEFYQSFLDPNMQYTCGLFVDANGKDINNLDDAQVAKMDLIARKLKLEPGMTVLDIGCGWGQLANYMAVEHGVDVTGITISEEQLAFAQNNFEAPSFRFQDYRDMDGSEKFDRVTSVGMIEHVGYKNYRTYMEMVRRALNPDGLFLLHTIGDNKSSVTGDPWLNKHIFPNGMLPSKKYLAAATEGLLIPEDEHSLGPHYDKTLMWWFENFDRNWPSLEGKLIDESQPSRGRYDDRFYRTMKYYFLMCAGSFRSRKVMQLWQNVYSANGVVGGYKSER